ncbi:Low affinity Fe/Cu permease [Nannocystis exedens]|uniref:Low affinity Fe/Cu permease n=1 Tax=Nannocystis exedens TaxID=54 RepID=A0A1I1WHU3_9BACT|nr:low affinity iron permease family protein [Nannocystis exedens]PCC67728.1 membrane protein [Nannocystis exedens]SFD94632.1 Low affinity Fe/Cu permease [Nannocystis exedens]
MSDEDRDPSSSGVRPTSERVSWGEHVAQLATRFVADSRVHWVAVLVVIAWNVTGPRVADWTAAYEWIEQVVASLSFLMLFLLQRSQNKDTLSLQLKLDELIASNPRASNRVLVAEDISEEELVRMRRHFRLLDRLAREAGEGPLAEENAYRRHEEEQRLQAEQKREP